jgi:hypothetical protein
MSGPAEPRLSADEIRDLREVAGAMIPESPGFGMPGADDPAILDDIVKSMGRDLPRVREALAEISVRSGGAFGALDRDKREALINGYHASGAPSIVTLGRVIVSAYYRDDRVLLALKHEARAPFPKGYEVEQGDWSLLDAVRGRPAFWRDDRKELARKELDK